MFKKSGFIFKAVPALLLALLWTVSVKAEGLSLEVQTPRVVSTGEVFRLTFVANSKVDNFIAPSVEGFTITAGPAQSTSTSVSIVNGKVTQSATTSFTYTLYAEKEGKFAIGSAKVKSGSDEAQTQPFSIECVKANTQQQAAAQQSGSSNTGKATASSNTGNDNNIFVAVTPSKTELYRGEHLVLTMKLYSQGTAIAGLENMKKPTFDGFWSQDIDVPTQINFQRENLNGTVYEAGLLSKQLLFPQQTGDLTIGSSELDVIVQVRTRPRDMFEDFFGGGYQNVRKHLQSKSIKIKVKDLPAGAPASFSGAVGSFKIDAAISKAKLTANDATTLTIRISGNGNLKLVNVPKAELPVDFEVYDTKTTENIKNSDVGSNGYRQFEIPLIPRSAGDFTIPPIEFTYFNPNTGKYVTLHTQEQKISVEKDSRAPQGYTSSETRREGIKFLGKDIRFINTTETPIEQHFFLGSSWFYVCYIVLVLLFAATYMLLKKRIAENKNVILVKNKKANKVAKKRLKTSSTLLKMGNAQGFYDELLRAMWGYLSDKLSIPVAELSRESAQQAFAERSIEEPYIATFLSVIDECEFARYAPGSGRKEMEQVYNDAAGVISKLEQRIK